MDFMMGLLLDYALGIMLAGVILSVLLIVGGIVLRVRAKRGGRRTRSAWWVIATGVACIVVVPVVMIGIRISLGDAISPNSGVDSSFLSSNRSLLPASGG